MSHHVISCNIFAFLLHGQIPLFWKQSDCNEVEEVFLQNKDYRTENRNYGFQYVAVLVPITLSFPIDNTDRMSRQYKCTFLHDNLRLQRTEPRVFKGQSHVLHPIIEVI